MGHYAQCLVQGESWGCRYVNAGEGSWATVDLVGCDWVAIERWLSLDKGLGNLTSQDFAGSICFRAPVRASLPITYRHTGPVVWGLRQVTWWIADKMPEV